MKRRRKHDSTEEKAAIPRRRLLDEEPVSKVCDELGLQPALFGRWQKDLFEHGAAAFPSKTRSHSAAAQQRGRPEEIQAEEDNEPRLPRAASTGQTCLAERSTEAATFNCCEKR